MQILFFLSPSGIFNEIKMLPLLSLAQKFLRQHFFQRKKIEKGALSQIDFLLFRLAEHQKYIFLAEDEGKNSIFWMMLKKHHPISSLSNLWAEHFSKSMKNGVVVTFFKAVCCFAWLFIFFPRISFPKKEGKNHHLEFGGENERKKPGRKQ